MSDTATRDHPVLCEIMLLKKFSRRCESLAVRLFAPLLSVVLNDPSVSEFEPSTFDCLQELDTSLSSVWLIGEVGAFRKSEAWDGPAFGIATNGIIDGRPWAHWKGNEQRDRRSTIVRHSSTKRAKATTRKPKKSRNTACKTYAVTPEDREPTSACLPSSPWGSSTYFCLLTLYQRPLMMPRPLGGTLKF